MTEMSAPPNSPQATIHQYHNPSLHLTPSDHPLSRNIG